MRTRAERLPKIRPEALSESATRPMKRGKCVDEMRLTGNSASSAAQLSPPSSTRSTMPPRSRIPLANESARASAREGRMSCRPLSTQIPERLASSSTHLFSQSRWFRQGVVAHTRYTELRGHAAARDGATAAPGLQSRAGPAQFEKHATVLRPCLVGTRKHRHRQICPAELEPLGLR